MPATKPLLLLDVDGVINVFPVDGTVPPGCVEHSVAPTRYGGAATGSVFINPEVGATLVPLIYLFEVVWATTWENDANTWIAPILGLPELPVVELAKTPVSGRTTLGPLRKVQGIESFAGDRPLAWVDDDNNVATDWANHRNAHVAPTLLVTPENTVGLTAEHIDQIADWYMSLTSETSA